MEQSVFDSYNNVCRNYTMCNIASNKMNLKLILKGS